MADKWDALEKTHKKLDAKAKRFSKPYAEKMKKQVKDALDATWSAEDGFVDALKAAKDNGMTGTKVADFAKDKDCSSTLAAFKKAAERHAKDAKNLRLYCEGARAIDGDFQKLLKDLEKEMKAVKDKTSKEGKAKIAFEKEVTEQAETVKMIAGILGTMTPAELMYGDNFDKVLDRIMKKSKKDGAATAADADKLLDLKLLTKNLKLADKLANQVADQCSEAMEKAEANPKDALPFLKKADAILKDLTKLDKDYQAAAKKNAEKIKQDKANARKILKAIDGIHQWFEDASHVRAETVKEITRKKKT